MDKIKKKKTKKIKKLKKWNGLWYGAFTPKDEWFEDVDKKINEIIMSLNKLNESVNIKK